jgi:hypothetical protein
LRIALAAICLLAGFSVAAAPPPALTKALSGPTKAFEGRQHTVVTMNGSSVSSDVQIWGNGAGAIRRSYTGGTTTLQTRSHVWQKAGSGPWVRVNTLGGPDAPGIAKRLAANYRVVVQPGEVILGRKCASVRIEPRYAFNPSRRMWLDESTGLLLKDELYAPGGKLRSSTVFVSLSVRPQPAALFTPPAKASDADTYGPASFKPLASAAAVQRQCGRPLLLPRYVPSGFTIETRGAMSTRMGRTHPAVRYSDGLAAFTIFQRGYGARMRGPASTNQYSVVAAVRPQSNYLLVGDIDEIELRKVAASLP